jgi:hypothetical protein
MRRWYAARTISAKKFLAGQWQEEITETGGQNEKEAGQVFPPPFFPMRGSRLT